SGAARVRRNSEPYFKDPQQSRWRRGGLPCGSGARRPRAVLQRLEIGVGYSGAAAPCPGPSGFAQMHQNKVDRALDPDSVLR
ncbi:MAG: hypothetical protein ACREX9_24205, partial [Gammaproteobacteria bacterium]